MVAQTVKNLLAMQETWVQSLGQEDPLEKEIATHSSILPRESHGQRSLAGYSQCGHKESDMTEQLNNKNNFTIYEIGQKVHLGFSVIFYGKTQTNLWANPMLYQLTSFEGF